MKVATDSPPLVGLFLCALTAVAIGINGKIIMVCTTVVTPKGTGYKAGTILIDGTITD